MARRTASAPAMNGHMLGHVIGQPVPTIAQPQRPPQLLLSVEDAMAVLSMTRPRFYREVNRDRIKTIKDGKRRLVPYLALVDYTRRLCAENGFDYDTLAG